VYADPSSLSRLDYSAAIIIHVVVVALLMALASWYPQSAPVLPRAVQVQLIPVSALPESKPKPKPAPKPEAKPKPEPKPTPKPKPEPKPVAKPKPKPQMKEEDFFAPLVSTRESMDSEPPPPLVSEPEPQAEPAPVEELPAMEPLSEREIDHYIANIQREVQRHWKVPASLSGNLADPIVTMDLNVDGSVRRLEIAISSGSPALDQSLLRAIEKAQPFIIPARSFELFRSNRIRFHPLR